MSTKAEALTNELTSDKEFMTKLSSCETTQEISELLAEKGVKASPEEIDDFFKNLPASEELSEKELASVAGGTFLKYITPTYWLGRLLGALVSKDLC